MTINDWADVDATTLAERVKKGDVSPEELVEQAIAAVEAFRSDDQKTTKSALVSASPEESTAN